MAQTMTGGTIRSDDAQRHSLRDWAGWDYLPGIAFLVVGVVALAEPPVASFAAGIYVGVMLCVAGGFMLAGGFANIGHRGGWLGIVLGLLALIAGGLALYNPVIGAVSLVWVMGAWFIVGGIFELAMALRMPVGRGWLIFVGLVNVALGAFMLTMQPVAAFQFLGFFVGISLVFRGLWSLVFTGGLHPAEDPSRAIGGLI